MAGWPCSEAAELAKKALACDFRNIDPRAARVILVEAGPRVLATFSEKSSQVALRSLERLGVEVLLGNPVSHCDKEGVVGRYIAHLIRNRVTVLITWIWAYITFQHGSRLITGSDAEAAADAATVSEPSDAQS